MLYPSESSKKTSWLSLVAETAGVAGATIVRVGLDCTDEFVGSATVFVQVIDQSGRVVGAGRRVTTTADLRSGISVDVGCDLLVTDGSTVIAWMESGVVRQSARYALAPRRAVAHDFRDAVHFSLRHPAWQTKRSLPSAAALEHVAA